MWSQQSSSARRCFTGERRFIHVATLAAGGSLDCSFDKIHNFIIIAIMFMYLFIYAYNVSNLK